MKYFPLVKNILIAFFKFLCIIMFGCIFEPLQRFYGNILGRSSVWGARRPPPVAESREPSEWPRSVCNAGDMSSRRTQGTATGERGDRRQWRSQKRGPRKACFVGRGEVKMLLEFPVYRKCKVASCTSTKRGAVIDR